VSVPEDYTNPTGRRIELFVARVPALNRRKQPDPLVILAGGPGLGASVFYPGIAPNLARVRRDRDILVVDQRGTGRSNPLNCAFDEQKMWEASEEETSRVMAVCLAQLREKNDVSQFTTSIAVKDLESVRLALGYPQQPIGPLMRELTQLQDIAFQLLEGRQRPTQTAGLYLLTTAAWTLAERAMLRRRLDHSAGG